MGRDSIEELGIANVQRSFNWSSRLLKCMGIWPLKNYDPIFLFFLTYLFLQCSLSYTQMFLSPKTIDNVLSSVAQNIPLMMTFTKIMITKMNREALGKLLTEIKEYSLTEKYETIEEKMTFVNYTKLPPRFILVTVFSMTLSDILYYTHAISFGIQIAKENNSMGYQLPYRSLNMDIRDVRIYALICIYQMMYIPSILFGYVGFDCMFVNLSIQVIAQFAILSYKVKTELNYSENFHEGMKKLILRHYRLIRLTEELENNFNFPIMQQLMGSSMHICISGYYVLMGQEMEDSVTTIMFILYVSSVINTLFIYCFIGECFIQESTNFGNAMYNYEWYNLPASDSKFFLMCMMRTRKPQCLTSGKFSILSLTVFSGIVKASMGYFSVLRTFL